MFYLRSHEAPAEPVAIELPRIEERIARLTTNSGNVRAMTLSPDGEVLYVLLQTAEAYELWVNRLRHDDVRRAAVFPAAKPAPGDPDGVDLLLIYDTSGKLIRKHDSVTSGFAGVGVAGTAGGDAPYRVGTVVTAFDSGQPAWPSAGTVPDELAYGLTIEAIGDKALVSYPSCAQCVDATSNVMTGYTLDGGHNLWPQIHETLSSREWVTDGERIIWLDENKVAALDVATGRQAWAVPAGTGDPDYSGPGSLYRAGAGFVLRTKHYLTYFRPDA